MDEPSTDSPAGCLFELASTRLLARASGALWIPDFKTLIVSDLHLGKAERNARRGGGLWPPYDNDATLTRLETEVSELKPQMIVTLGDSFDDDHCAAELAESDKTRISALSEGRRFIWITGNHDPTPNELRGENVETLMIGALTLRHIANAHETNEISGHYHPKANFFVRGRRIARKCFLLDDDRLILPAFGAYTGGLDIFDPVFHSLFGPKADAILTGEKALRTPVAKLRQLAA